MDRLAYIALRLVEMLVQAMPLSWAYAAARAVGDAMYLFDRRHTQRALEHLRASFPARGEGELRRIARGASRNLVYLGLEALLTPRLVRLSTWRRYIRLGPGVSRGLRTALERPGGALFLSAHLGNFEVVGYGLATLGFRTNALARRLDNPHLDRHLLGIREKQGQRILDKQGAMREVPELLRRGQIVSFIADQDAGRRGIFIDFFGRPASTYRSFALMAMRFELPVVVGWALRVGETYRFDFVAERVMLPEEWADRDDPVRYIAEAYTRALEDGVRRAPEQYFWVYRRWKTPPPEARK